VKYSELLQQTGSAYAMYSQGQKDYLYSLGDDPWAKAQIATENWYVDANNNTFLTSK
jgi:hypothetical protein